MVDEGGHEARRLKIMKPKRIFVANAVVVFVAVLGFWLRYQIKLIHACTVVGVGTIREVLVSISDRLVRQCRWAAKN